MKLVTDGETAAWLAERPSFQWDAGNSTKSEVKHGHSVEEVESMMKGNTLLAGRIIEPDRGEPRWLLLGTSASGAPLALVFARRGDLLRPISCRAMRKNERRLYGKAIGH
ncbi:MAG: BrnT family toxin [Deltaproteobacteria bacterium]|nr:BrnT family toxin [Deltaproteobacteria bacterium]